MRIVIIENVITPYEIKRFNVLNEVLDNNLTVFFQNETDMNRNWRFDLSRLRFKYKILPDTPFRMKGKDIFTMHINYTAFSELKNACPDVVVSCGWDSLASYMAYIYCRIYNKKFILWSGSTINEPSWRRTVSKPLVKYLVRNSDSYIAYGTRAKEYLMDLGAEKDRIFMGWNTVDNSFFEINSRMTTEEREALRFKLGIKTGLALLYAGQLIERKGVYDLLSAFSWLKKDIKDVTLLIAGAGMEEDAMKKRCLQENIDDVVFAGFVEYEQLPRYFGLADLFLLPSHEEVWGLVINEAMASGLPVITTDKVGASADLVRDGVNGFVVRDSDPHELYNAMKKMTADNGLRQKMADASRQMIRNYGAEHTAEGVKEAILCAASQA
ncbi:MAG: glycosyltransferase [Nitrospirae bacterium]|nr:glycosyltransferase [Nitrospirota bacterium]